MAPTRRRFIQSSTLATAGALTGLAGCMGGSGGDTPTESAMPTPSPTSSPTPPMAEVTVTVSSHPTFGEILTDGEGRTLYLLTADPEGESVCTGGCADAWPPLTVEGEDALVESVRTDVALGTTEHPEAGPMATAAGHPLYYFEQDEEPGDANGQGLNDAWYVLDPDGNAVGT